MEEVNILDTLPKEILFEGELCKLHVERDTNSRFILTYEYEPVNEDLFLASVINDDMEMACKIMASILRREGIFMHEKP